MHIILGCRGHVTRVHGGGGGGETTVSYAGTSRGMCLLRARLINDSTWRSAAAVISANAERNRFKL